MMEHEAVAARIQIGTADQQEPVYRVEQSTDRFDIGQRWYDHRNATGGFDRIEIPGRQVGVGGRRTVGGTKVGVDPDQRLARHLKIPFRYART